MTAKEFRHWRKRMGYSLAQAGRALGVTPRTIALYEKGEKPVPGNPSATTDITIPHAVALACAALLAGLEPLGEVKPKGAKK